MISAVIIEDSRLARQELKEMLKEHPQVFIAGEADTADDAIKLIGQVKPDLIFLDIHLPGKSGFDMLQELDSVPAVIFTTAFDQYAIQAFDYQTIDYLLKPIVPERLDKAIAKAEEQLAVHQSTLYRDKLMAADRIFVKDKGKAWFVTLGDIRLFESRGNYTQIYFQQNSPLILKPLQQIDDMLDDKQFVRVNRQQIIGVKFIADVSPWFGNRLKITLSTGEGIEVSRRQVNKIKVLFSL
jgi:two-component system LytT family response regulator